MNTLKLACVALPLMASVSGVSAAPSAEQWQLTRLFNPTAHQIQREQKGQVFIYDGLTGRHIEQAMELAFDRVQAMMFVNVVKTDERGAPIVNEETGEPETEDDGC